MKCYAIEKKVNDPRAEVIPLPDKQEGRYKLRGYLRQPSSLRSFAPCPRTAKSNSV